MLVKLFVCICYYLNIYFAQLSRTRISADKEHDIFLKLDLAKVKLKIKVIYYENGYLSNLKLV